MANISEALFKSVLAGKPFKCNDDLSGQTLFGISRSSWPNWKGWMAIDALLLHSEDSLENIHQDGTLIKYGVHHYQINFWEYMELEGLASQVVANDVFDIAIAVGRIPTIKALQHATNILVDNEKFYPMDVTGEPSPHLVNRVNRMIEAGLPVHSVFLSLIGYKLPDNFQREFWMKRV